MTGTERSLRTIGRPAAESRPLALRAGRVTALLDGPDLRHVRVGGVELIQRVYVAVRDAPWNTIPATFSAWRHDIGDDRFLVEFEARHRHEAIAFDWAGRIEGTPDGVIRYTMDGACRGVFQYSKIGFNVHHDLPGSIGRPFRARNGDRTWEGVLPTAIDPQRIVDGTLSGMFEPYEELAIEVADGLEAIIALEGDVLEMQDHRNWTDANFKSYGTPLALGFPFDSADGQRLHQALTIRHRGDPGSRPAAAPTLTVGGPTGGRMPAIGLGMASHGQPLTAAEAALVAAMEPDHLRVDLYAGGDAWSAALDLAVGDALAVGAALELAVHATDGSGPELGRLAARLAEAGVPVARVLVYPLADGFSAFVSTTPAALVALVREALEPFIGPAIVAGGTNQSFADINRARPTDPAMRGLCFSISPTIHAADDASIVENLVGQSEVVRFAREIAAPRSIHVSPVTIATRGGPYPAGPSGPEDPPPAVDVRQLSLLGAAWTAGSVGELARAGAASVTYYETSGWRGVLEREAGSPLPNHFQSTPGDVFPLFHVLADALEARGGAVLDLVPSDPLLVGGFAVDLGPRTLAVIANLTPDEQDVVVRGMPAGPVDFRTLDIGTVAVATADPQAFRRARNVAARDPDGAIRLRLDPYAVARLAG